MNSETELGPQLGARLSYLLKRAFLELEELHAEYLASTGVNARELAVLLLLDGREPESQQQAAGRLGVDRTTMVGLLDGLEGKGLVARQADAGDRRRNVVGLTDDRPADAEEGEGGERRGRTAVARRTVGCGGAEAARPARAGGGRSRPPLGRIVACGLCPTCRAALTADAREG